MDIQEISNRLEKDAMSLASPEEREVMDFINRINNISQSQDASARNRQLTDLTWDFYEYICDHSDWASALPKFNIESEDMEALCFAAQMLGHATDRPLSENSFFMVGMRQLLTVFNYENSLERAFASQQIEGWTHCFGESIFPFFEDFLEHLRTNKIPNRLPTLPEDMTPEECVTLFRLEMNRARERFIQAYTDYNSERQIFEEGEFEEFLQENFNGIDPDPDGKVGEVLCRRLLLYIEWYIS